MTKASSIFRRVHRSPLRFSAAAFLVAATLLLAGCMAEMPSWPRWFATDAPLPPVELDAWLPVQSDEEAALLAEQIGRVSAVEGSAAISVTLTAADGGNLDRILRGADPPDLFEVDLFRLPDLVEEGLVAPVPPGLAAGDAFIPAMVDAATVDGQLFCVPKDANTLGLFYNQDLFDAAGIVYPTENWTWDDLRSAAQTVSGLPTVKFTAFGLVLGDDITRWLPFLIQAGGDWGGDRAATQMTTARMSEAVGQALTFYDGLLIDGFAIPLEYYGNAWSGTDFGNGRVGMVFEGNWLHPYLATDYPNIRYGVAPLPAGPGGEGTLLFGTCYAVASASQHHAEAFALIDTLADSTAMRERLAFSAALPARESLMPAWDERYPELRSLRTQLDDATVWQATGVTGRLLPELRRLLRDVLAGDLFVEEALAEYDAAVQSMGE